MKASGQYLAEGGGVQCAAGGREKPLSGYINKMQVAVA